MSEKAKVVVGLLIVWVFCTGLVYIGAQTFGRAPETSVVVSAVVALAGMGVGGALWLGDTWWDRRREDDR